MLILQRYFIFSTVPKLHLGFSLMPVIHEGVVDGKIAVTLVIVRLIALQVAIQPKRNLETIFLTKGPILEVALFYRPAQRRLLLFEQKLPFVETVEEDCDHCYQS